MNYEINHKKNFDMPFHYLNDFKKDWITAKIDEAGIQYLSDFGLFLCDKTATTDKFPGFNGVTTSQLRNIFSEVKRIQLRIKENDDWKTEVLMLRPKIAYNTARTLQRSKNSRMKELREVLEKALLLVSEKQHFTNFSKFFEAIIAYHKVYGGRD
jgi:CRISPR-associated protein Csm2